jgi:predicted acetyltransferase
MLGRMAANLRLRPLGPEDERPGRAAHDELADYDFFLDYDRHEPWTQFVERMQRQRRGIDVAPDRVRAAFLVAWVDDQIVGRTSIRFDLNDYLAQFGGHIGYAVLPAHRRQGYAREILEQSLVVARSEGVDAVLVTCDVENVASRLVIERCGGEYEDIVHDPREQVEKRRYWIR